MRSRNLGKNEKWKWNVLKPMTSEATMVVTDSQQMIRFVLLLKTKRILEESWNPFPVAVRQSNTRPIREMNTAMKSLIWKLNGGKPHRQPPTRLLCPWDSPGKNTGVGCHFLLQCMKVKSESEVAQSCLTLSNLMDCSPPGSSVHGIFQARVLEPLPSLSQPLDMC